MNIIRNVDNDTKWTAYWYNENDYNYLAYLEKKVLLIRILLKINNLTTSGIRSKMRIIRICLFCSEIVRNQL